MKTTLLLVLLVLGLAPVRAGVLNSNTCVRIIVGEAAGEPYQCKLAIAAVLRNRGTTQGAYGGNAKHVKTEPKHVWTDARRAWNESLTNDPTGGCKHWGGNIDDHYFRDELHWTPVLTIGHTSFYK